MIDSDKNLSPVKKLEKIGYGSDMCVMSFSSYNKHYPDLLKSIPDALKQTGFNGYFYYRLGGYPNPTGQEAQFIGVPYAFKIFMMLEAYKMGFTKIIWIDASMLPLNDPTILFTLLDSSETYFYGYAKDEFANILPPIKRLLKDFTGTDVLAHNLFCAGIMGLKMNSRIVHDLIKIYYKLVSKGTPFLSCEPEEFVLMAILGQPDYEKHRAQFRHKLLHWPIRGWENESSSDIMQAKKEGFYFYLRAH